LTGSLAAAIENSLAFRHEANRRAMARQKLARTLFNVRVTAQQIASIYRQILLRHKMGIKNFKDSKLKHFERHQRNIFDETF
jgi:hypothetical protein